MSYIYDFIVLPTNSQNRELSTSLKTLMSEERNRYEEFAKNADNCDRLNESKKEIFKKIENE